MRHGGIFSPLGAVEVSDEDKKAAASEYEALARQCYEQKLSSACAKKAALVGSLGPSLASLIDGCAQGSRSDCVKAQAIQGATSTCTAYAGPEAAPVCAWVASKVIGKVWPWVESGASAAANMASSLLSYGLETIGIKDKPNFFEDIGNDMKEEAIRRRDQLVGGFVRSTVDGIMSSRAELAVSGDRITVHTGQEMSVEEMVWWSLNSNLDPQCVLRGKAFSSVVGSYGRLWYYQCSFGAGASVDMTVPVTKRKDAYSKAADEYSRQIQADFKRLSDAMRSAASDAVVQEAQNPATIAAMNRKALRDAASLAKAIGLRRDTLTVKPTLANSVQSGTDGRMRLLLVAMAAAVGVGLALGRKKR